MGFAATDPVLAIARHLLIFMPPAVLAFEIGAIRADMTGRDVRRVVTARSSGISAIDFVGARPLEIGSGARGRFCFWRYRFRAIWMLGDFGPRPRCSLIAWSRAGKVVVFAGEFRW